MFLVRPALRLAAVVLSLATLSLPGLAPFISEFLVLLGTFNRYWLAAAFGSTALILSSIYMLWLYQRLMTGPVPEGWERQARIRDLVPREVAVVAPLILLLLVFGVYPKPLLDIINPAVGHTMSTIHQHDPAPKVPAGTAPRTAEGPRR